jgi:hypothetical protein
MGMSFVGKRKVIWRMILGWLFALVVIQLYVFPQEAEASLLDPLQILTGKTTNSDQKTMDSPPPAESRGVLGVVQNSLTTVISELPVVSSIVTDEEKASPVVKPDIAEQPSKPVSTSSSGISIGGGLLPELKVQLPSITVNTPLLDVDIPTVKVQIKTDKLPQVTLDVKVSVPKILTDIPILNLDTPVIEAEAPLTENQQQPLTVEPAAAVIQVHAPKTDIKLPSTTVVSVQTPVPVKMIPPEEEGQTAEEGQVPFQPVAADPPWSHDDDDEQTGDSGCEIYTESLSSTEPIASSESSTWTNLVSWNFQPLEFYAINTWLTTVLPSSSADIGSISSSSSSGAFSGSSEFYANTLLQPPRMSHQNYHRSQLSASNQWSKPPPGLPPRIASSQLRISTTYQ